MDVNRNQQIKDIIRISAEMLSKARDNDWEKVAVLEARRKDLVMLFFQQPTARQDAAQTATAIQEILRLNQEITDLGRQSQNRLGNEIHTRNVGRAAAAAYRNCTR
ncbi:flagellar protein FliT [Thiogranum longum]|jgi:hypothetical protein